MYRETLASAWGPRAGEIRLIYGTFQSQSHCTSLLYKMLWYILYWLRWTALEFHPAGPGIQTNRAPGKPLHAATQRSPTQSKPCSRAWNVPPFNVVLDSHHAVGFRNVPWPYTVSIFQLRMRTFWKTGTGIFFFFLSSFLFYVRIKCMEFFCVMCFPKFSVCEDMLSWMVCVHGTCIKYVRRFKK